MLGLRRPVILMAALIWLAPGQAGIAKNSLGAALREARLVSSYYSFARRCHEQGAISAENLTGFRNRLIEAIIEKHALDATEAGNITRIVDSAASDEIRTASLPLNNRVCERFLRSI